MADVMLAPIKNPRSDPIIKQSDQLVVFPNL